MILKNRPRIGKSVRKWQEKKQTRQRRYHALNELCLVARKRIRVIVLPPSKLNEWTEYCLTKIQYASRLAKPIWSMSKDCDQAKWSQQVKICWTNTSGTCLRTGRHVVPLDRRLLGWIDENDRCLLWSCNLAREIIVGPVLQRGLSNFGECDSVV